MNKNANRYKKKKQIKSNEKLNHIGNLRTIENIDIDYVESDSPKKKKKKNSLN